MTPEDFTGTIVLLLALIIVILVTLFSFISSAYDIRDQLLLAGVSTGLGAGAVGIFTVELMRT